jgi:hypothetical protein
MAIMIVSVIMRMPMRMITVIIIPIIGSPWIPVRWIIAPIPW